MENVFNPDPTTWAQEVFNYGHPQNESFCEKLESMQYKAALAIAGVIQSTSREKIYQELGLESLKCRRWYKRLSWVFKIMNKAPNYLLNLIPKSQQIITTWDSHKPNYQCRTNYFKYFFFLRFKRLVQLKCFHKILRVHCSIQK